MNIDPEMVEAFSQELLEIKKELKAILEKLKLDYQNPPAFVPVSNIFDRIYGTAITLGYKEVGDYCKAVKDLALTTSKSHAQMHTLGQSKDTCFNAYLMLDSFANVIKNPTELKKIQYGMQGEIIKIQALEKKLLA